MSDTHDKHRRRALSLFEKIAGRGDTYRDVLSFRTAERKSQRPAPPDRKKNSGNRKELDSLHAANDNHRWVTLR